MTTHHHGAGAANLAIPQADRAIVQAILAEHLPASARIRVFGSRATGRAKPRSDLDLAIDAGRPLTLPEMANLSDAFEESDLPFRVDIVDFATLSDSFREIIERGGVALDVQAKVS